MPPHLGLSGHSTLPLIYYHHPGGCLGILLISCHHPGGCLGTLPSPSAHATTLGVVWALYPSINLLPPPRRLSRHSSLPFISCHHPRGCLGILPFSSSHATTLGVVWTLFPSINLIPPPWAWRLPRQLTRYPSLHLMPPPWVASVLYSSRHGTPREGEGHFSKPFALVVLTTLLEFF